MKILPFPSHVFEKIPVFSYKFFVCPPLPPLYPSPRRAKSIPSPRAIFGGITIFGAFFPPSGKKSAPMCEYDRIVCGTWEWNISFPGAWETVVGFPCRNKGQLPSVAFYSAKICYHNFKIPKYRIVFDGLIMVVLFFNNVLEGKWCICSINKKINPAWFYNLCPVLLGTFSR